MYLLGKGGKPTYSKDLGTYIGVGFTKEGKCPMFAEDIGTKAR